VIDSELPLAFFSLYQLPTHLLLIRRCNCTVHSAAAGCSSAELPLRGPVLDWE